MTNFCSFGRKLFSALYQSVRFRRIPDPGTLEQRLFKAVLKPVIPPLNVTHLDRRLRRKEEIRALDENNQYRKFLIERAKEEFFEPLNEKLLLVLHPNQYKRHELNYVRNSLFDKGLIFKGFPVSILREAAKGTRYEMFSQYVLHTNVKNYYVVGDATPEVCQSALSILSKSSVFIVLCGLVQYRLMTVDQLSAFSKYSNGGLNQAQSEFLGTLEQVRGEDLLKNLSYHQTTIVRNLKYLSN